VLRALHELTSELQALEASTVSPEVSAESVELVAQWAREHPIDNPLLLRDPVSPLAASALFSRRAGLGDTLANAETAMQQLGVRASVYAEYLPRQIQWNLEALTLELTLGEEGARTIENLLPVAHYLDRIETLLDDDLRLVLAGAESLRRDTFTDLHGETSSLLGAVSQQREATLDAVSDERRVILAALHEERQRILDRMGQEREAATRDVQKIVQGSLDQAEVSSRRILDLAFTRALLLTGVWFASLVGYRLLVHRLRLRREQG
jgi:hypothetical protein